MMEIIDHRGRLFGMINLIDFFALLLLLVLIRMFFLGHQLNISNKKALAEVRQEENLRALRNAEARARNDAFTKKTVEDRLVHLEATQAQIDNGLREISESVRKLHTRKKNFSP